jgi:hypothetical protein
MKHTFSLWQKIALILSFNIFLIIQAYPQTFEERLDRYISSFPKHEEFQGVVLAAVEGKIVLHKGYGFSSREYRIPNGPDTKFQVGSISKAFAGILVMKMVEKGLIDLDRTICDYLPFYPENPGKKITIHHLLSHSSGIPHHYIAVPDYWKRHDKVFHTPKELLELFSHIPLAHDPGEQFTYSSPGFYILGAILEKVGKKCYAELLRENIFNPLGMKNTLVENNRSVQRGMATGYMRGLTGLIRAGFEDKSTALAAGDLVSTAYDLFLWDKGMKAVPETILTAGSKKCLYEEIFPGHVMTCGGPVFRIPYDEGRKILTLNRLSGSSAGYMAAMDRIYDPDACVIILSNVQDTETLRIVDHISDFLLRQHLGLHVGSPAPPTLTPPPVADVSSKDIEKIIGFYRHPNGSISGVLRDGGKLYLLRYSKGDFAQSALQLVPESPDVFALGYLTNMKCQFTRDEKDGVLTLATLRNGHSVSVAKKIEAKKLNLSEYDGFYTSVELQETFRFSETSSGISAENFLGKTSVRMVCLEKDLFGFDFGFAEFMRYPDGTILGFKLVKKDLDLYMGSKFIKL